MSISKRLWIHFLLVLSFVGMFVAYIQWQLTSIERVNQHVVDVRKPITDIGNELLNHLTSSFTDLQGWLLNKNPRYTRQRQEALHQVQVSLSQLRTLAPESAHRWRHVAGMLNQLAEAQARVEALAHSADQYPATKLYDTKINTLYQLQLRSIDEWLDQARQSSFDQQQKARFLALSDLRHSVVAGHASFGALILTRRHQHWQVFEKHWRVGEQALKALRQPGSELGEAFKRVPLFRQQLYRHLLQAKDIVSSDQWDMAHYTLRRDVMPLGAQLVAQMRGDDQGVKGFLPLQSELLQEDVTSLSQMINQLLLSMLLLSLLAIGGYAGLTWQLVRAIKLPIDRIKRTLRQLTREQKFSVRAQVDSEGEVGEMACELNHFLERLQQILQETNQVAEGMAQGDLSQRIELDSEGDFLRLKKSLNRSMDQLGETVEAVVQMLKTMAEGRFDQPMRCEGEGVYQALSQHGAQSMQVINASIQALYQVMHAVAQGDFSQRIDAPLPGDFDALKNHVNNTLNEIERAVGEINRVTQAMADKNLSATLQGDYQGQLGTLSCAINCSVRNLAGVLEEVKGLSSEVLRGADEVSHDSENLCARTQSQASAIEQTLVSIQAISDSVGENSESTERAMSLFHRAVEKVTYGTQVMRHTVGAIHQVEKMSGEIERIIDVIGAMAFQTNILSLNAAVEAARAGGHGHQFAVVADEVRGLAMRSTEASDNIKQLIEDSVARVNEGVTWVHETEVALRDLGIAIHSVHHIVEDIASASQRQSEGVRQVCQAVASIEQSTQQSARIGAQSASTSAQLKQKALSMGQQVNAFVV